MTKLPEWFTSYHRTIISCSFAGSSDISKCVHKITQLLSLFPELICQVCPLPPWPRGNTDSQTKHDYASWPFHLEPNVESRPSTSFLSLCLSESLFQAPSHGIPSPFPSISIFSWLTSLFICIFWQYPLLNSLYMYNCIGQRTKFYTKHRAYWPLAIKFVRTDIGRNVFPCTTNLIRIWLIKPSYFKIKFPFAMRKVSLYLQLGGWGHVNSADMVIWPAVGKLETANFTVKYHDLDSLTITDQDCFQRKSIRTNKTCHSQKSWSQHYRRWDIYIPDTTAHCP